MNCGATSATLGGENNNIGIGYDHVGIFGFNVNAVASCTFHVNCLNACDTPAGHPVGWPNGTIYYIIGTPPAGSKALYIV